MTTFPPVDGTEIERALRERAGQKILVLDGAMGTVIQRLKFTEEDFRGERFKHWKKDLKGHNDLLNLTQPAVVEDIHRWYLEAGADIVETNTFNSQAISLADYLMGELAYELSKAGAECVRRAVQQVLATQPGRRCFVAGAIGPTTKTSSISTDVSNPAARGATFEQLVEAYSEQVRGLLDGGVDLLLVETIFDTLNAKAAIVAAREVAPELPLWLSFTAIDRSGRNLSGQTAEAFWVSVEHARPLIAGVNCSLGATEMRPFLEDLARVADTYVSCYPNAGLPNAMGEHDEQPADTSRYLRAFAEDGLVNVVGGFEMSANEMLPS